MLITLFPIHHTRAGRFPPIYRPALFFVMLGKAKFCFLAYSLLFCSPSFAQVDGQDSLSKRISELRLKSNAHGKFVSELLADPFEFREIQVPEKIDQPELPSNRVDETLKDQELKTETYVPERGLLTDGPQLENEPSLENEDQDLNPLPMAGTDGLGDPIELAKESVEQETSSETIIHESKPPTRREGYYFGPFVGFAFPDDSAVRYPKVAYSSDGGVVAGLRFGHDFGRTRLEGDYSFLTHKIKNSSGSGRSNLHNFQSRFIFEHEVGSRADLRAGIGLGLGIVDQELAGKDYNGVGFSYDFLLGWSFRAMENWSINLDYRHYLTAAHKNYDRLQGHIIELSAGFDF